MSKDDGALHAPEGFGRQTFPKHVTRVSLSIEKLNPLLMCPACMGYPRDATTVRECLHTFCRSCILVHVHGGGKACPAPGCGADLGVHPLEGIQYDRSKQELVDRIFPHLRRADAEQERAFYAARGISRRPAAEPAPAPLPPPPGGAVAAAAAAEPGGGGRRRGGVRGGGGGSGRKRPRPGEMGNGAAAAAPGVNNILSSEMITFNLIPLKGLSEDNTSGGGGADGAAAAAAPAAGPLPPLDTATLRCSGKLKVLQLKKYLAMTFQLEHRNEVTISCKQTNLGDELSLFYIRRTLWKYEEDADLVLHYFRNKEYDIEYFDDEEEDNDES